MPYSFSVGGTAYVFDILSLYGVASVDITDKLIDLIAKDMLVDANSVNHTRTRRDIDSFILFFDDICHPLREVFLFLPQFHVCNVKDYAVFVGKF